MLTFLLHVLYGSQNRDQILPYEILADWFRITEVRVFTARYVLSPCIEQSSNTMVNR